MSHKYLGIAQISQTSHDNQTNLSYFILSFVLTEGLGFDLPFVKNYGYFGRSTAKPKNFNLKWRQILVIMQLPTHS